VRGALTGRGAGLAGSVVPLYALGEWLGYPVLRALAVVSLAAVVVSVLTAVRPLRLGVRRDLDRTRVHRGRNVEVRLTVTNRGRRRQPALAAIDARPVRIPALPAGKSATVAYRLEAERRGRLEIGPLRVDRADPLGLTDRRRRVPGVTQLWVYPRIHPIDSWPGGPSLRHSDAATAVANLRGSTQLRTLRQYVPGDEPRHIHWKATATTGTLMVRDLRDPAEPSMLVLLDDRTGALDPERFEEAVDLTASLLVSASGAGHRIRLRTATGVDLRPRAGRSGSGAVLEALCTLRQGRGGTFGPAQPGDGTVVHVTGVSTGGFTWTAGSGGGPRVLVDLRAEVPAPRVPGVLVLRGTRAADVAAAWNGAVR
jgi:uncharacterized protein (DUF58 family)